MASSVPSSARLLRIDLEQLSEPGLAGALAAIYHEPVPVGAGVSMFDVQR